MRLHHLGIDPKTRHHSTSLTFAESTFVGILWTEHVGNENKISADALAVVFARAMSGVEINEVDAVKALPGIKEEHRTWLEGWKRDVREMQLHLLTQHDRIPILSKAGPDGGYWLSNSEDEADQFFHTFRRRGLTGIIKASRGKKAILVDIMRQVSFEFEDLIDQTGLAPAGSDMSGVPAPIQVVDAFLSKMLKNPEEFSDGLRKLSEKYGSVLMPKDRLDKIKNQTAALQEALSGL